MHNYIRYKYSIKNNVMSYSLYVRTKEAQYKFPGKPKGFYAISLPGYGLNGIVPPIDNIDQLMRRLGVG